MHELRLFAISTSIKAASVHLLARKGASTHAIRRAATKILRDLHDYDMVTVQVERAPVVGQDDLRSCVQCKAIGGNSSEGTEPAAAS